MNAILLDVEQRSPEWMAARVGRLTSTGAAEMLATTKKGEESASRRNLRNRLALEQIVNRSLERDFTTPAIQDGIDREAEAIAAYEARSGELVTRVGFLQHPTLMAGTSVDGMIEDFAGLVEIKCPEHSAHLDALQSNAVPTKYLHQVTHHLWMSGAAWCDWMSFNPDFPAHLRTVLIRVERASIDLTAYELAVTLFLSEVAKQVETIRQTKGVA